MCIKSQALAEFLTRILGVSCFSNEHELKVVFHFNCIAAKRTVFHCFVRTQKELIDMDTIEYATFRYDTVEVENGL